MSTSPPHDALTRGYLTALASAATLSTTAIFIRYLTENYQMPPLLLAFWRAVFVVCTLLLALGVLRRRLLPAGRGHLPYLATYGLVLAFFNAPRHDITRQKNRQSSLDPAGTPALG